jgi:hypothetical protein
VSAVLPLDVACCPDCLGEVAMVDPIEDTLERQERQLVCLNMECGGSGSIFLGIRWRRPRRAAASSPAPSRPVHHARRSMQVIA